MDYYIIPANPNNGKLIFGLFNKFDLIMVLSGGGVTIGALLLFSPSSIVNLLLCLTPLLITAALVVPIPNYHNVYTVIKDIISFFYKRRNFKWEGWCNRDEYK